MRADQWPLTVMRLGWEVVWSQERRACSRSVKRAAGRRSRRRAATARAWGPAPIMRIEWKCDGSMVGMRGGVGLVGEGARGVSGGGQQLQSAEMDEGGLGMEEEESESDDSESEYGVDPLIVV